MIYPSSFIKIIKYMWLNVVSIVQIYIYSLLFDYVKQ